MALHTRAQFADACGVNTNYINTYIGRGKIILSGEFIDDTILQNQDFLKKMQEKKAKKTAEPPPKTTPTPIEIVPEDPDFSLLTDKRSNKATPSKQTRSNHSGKYDLEQRKLEIEIEKREQEVEKLKTYNAKQAGELVPIDLVTQLVKVHNQSILSTQETTIEHVLIMFSGDFKLTDAQTADIRGKLKRLLNEGLDKAIENTKRSIISIVEEFSSVRGVGDHA
jgi:hypothetical protein